MKIIVAALSFILIIGGLQPAQTQTLPTTAGWFEIPNTKLRTVCPPTNFGGATYDFPFYCQSVVKAWNSGIMDTTRNRLIVWGGGHNDYYGNELYAVNLNDLTIQRLNSPGLPLNLNGLCSVTALQDGSANSRHTYDGIVYMPNVDRMFVFGGAPACLAGGVNADTWTFDFATMKWQNMSPSGTLPRMDYGIVTAYDPNTGKIFVHDNWNLYTYDFASNNFKKVGTDNPVVYRLTGVIDPVRKKFVMVGGGQAWIYDISAQSGYMAQHLLTTGGDSVVNSFYPGLAYDPVSDRIVAWAGGNSVFKLNLDTGVWTPEVFVGGPGAAQIGGTYKRWSYSPASNVFVLVNDMNQNAFAYRLSSSGSQSPSDFSLTSQGNISANTGSSIKNQIISSSVSGPAQPISFSVSGLPPGATASLLPPSCVIGCSTSLMVSTVVATPGTYNITVTGIAGSVIHSTSFFLTLNASVSSPADFTARCSASGVVRCVGFDSDSDFNIGAAGVAGAYGQNFGITPPNGTSDYTRAVKDTTQKASGSSSLKFVIPSLSPADSSGTYFTNFSSDLSTQFGEGDEFFVQWRQRFSPEFLVNHYEPGMGWKQVIVGAGDQPGKLFNSCEAIEVVVQNAKFRDLPEMYNSCTGSTSHGAYDGFQEQFGGDLKLQNARPSPYCLYSQWFTVPSTLFPPSGNCFGYFSNEWMTFQLGLEIGPRVGDEFVGSYIRLWVAREGKPSELVTNFGPYNLSAGSLAENQRFGKIWLLPYQTSKDPTVSYPVAYTWYDELIVSRNKIADPPIAGNPGDTTPPTVTLSIKEVTSH